MSIKTIDCCMYGLGAEDEKNDGSSLTEQTDAVSVESVYNMFTGGGDRDDGTSLNKELEITTLPYMYKEDDLTNIDLLKGKKAMFEEREARVRGEAAENAKNLAKEDLYKRQTDALEKLAESFNQVRKVEK